MEESKAKSGKAARRSIALNALNKEKLLLKRSDLQLYLEKMRQGSESEVQDFLDDLGLREVVSDLRHRERDLARSGDAMQRLIVRSEATDAETLLHPRGLGDFRVMLARAREVAGELSGA